MHEQLRAQCARCVVVDLATSKQAVRQDVMWRDGQRAYAAGPVGHVAHNQRLGRGERLDDVRDDTCSR